MPETAVRPFTSASFYQFLREHKLMASRCAACSAIHVPPHAVCPECHSDSVEWVELSGRGKLAAFTAIYVAPSSMVEQGFGRERPYVSGVVDLEDGIRVSAFIEGVDAQRPQEIRIGTPVVIDYVDQAEAENDNPRLTFKAVHSTTAEG